MFAIFLAILLAVFVYWICVALGLPIVIAAVAAVLVLLAAFAGPRRSWW